MARLSQPPPHPPSFPAPDSSSGHSELQALGSIYFGKDGSSSSSSDQVVAPFIGPVKCVRTGGTKEGRGLVVTRDVKEGELLLVSKPLVSVPIAQAFEAFEHEGSGGRSLESLATQILLDGLIQLTSQSDAAAAIVKGMSDGEAVDLPLPDLPFVNQDAAALERNGGEELDPAYLSRIISSNNHGPDFKQYPQVTEDWRASGIIGPYRRLLGLYVVPSLINHSCLSNACRVFVGDTMFVRATRDLAAGEEVVNPYLAPFKILKERQDHLRAIFGFCCQCPRCVTEGELGQDYATLQDRVVRAIAAERGGTGGISQRELRVLMEEVEEVLSGVKGRSEVKRWARASFLPLYFAYFNSVGGAAAQTPEVIQRVSKLQAELHLSLSTVNNASTEHLSLLHTCYEMAGYHDGVGSAKSRFWILQLQRAHACRYGPLPPEQLLLLLKHTKGILRDPRGFYRAKYSFI